MQLQKKIMLLLWEWHMLLFDGNSSRIFRGKNATKKTGNVCVHDDIMCIAIRRWWDMYDGQSTHIFGQQLLLLQTKKGKLLGAQTKWRFGLKPKQRLALGWYRDLNSSHEPSKKKSWCFRTVHQLFLLYAKTLVLCDDISSRWSFCSDSSFSGNDLLAPEMLNTNASNYSLLMPLIP